MYIRFTANLEINNDFKQYIYSTSFYNIKTGDKSKNKMLCNSVNNAVSGIKSNIKNC